MSDSRKTLLESFGMPMAWVYDAQGRSIMLKDAYGEDINLNQLITNFRYKYDEEEDDECRIKIGITSIEQMNNSNFRIDSHLEVEWGYVLPMGELLKSPRLKIAVRDKEKDYKADGIILELICTDHVSYLKNIRLNQTSVHNNFEDWLKEILNGQFTATRTEIGKRRIIAKKKPKNLVEKEEMGVEKRQPGFESDNLNVNSVKDIDTYKGSIKQNSEYTIVKDPDQKIIGKSKAIAQEIKDKLLAEPNGPYYMNTRGDNIDIIKRDWNQPIFATYTYAGANGELIEFKPKSNVVKTDEDEIDNNYVNPITKRVETTRIAKASAHEELPPGVSQLDLIRFREKLELIWKHNSDPKNADNQIPVNNVTFQRNIQGGSTANVANVSGSTRVAFKYKDSYKSTIAAKSLIMSNFFQGLQRAAFLENFVMKKLERKFEGTAKVIGDPSLVNSKIYKLKGLSDDDNGNWYSSDVEHEIDNNSGYICKVGLLKKPVLLRTIMERREKDPNSSDNPGGRIDTTDMQITDNQLDNNQGLSVMEVSNRLAMLTMQENILQNGNDIPFETKESKDNTSQGIPPNLT